MALSPNDEKAIAALVELSKRGDECAFEQLFQLYSHPIYRYLRYMIADDEAARDLLQDSFLKAWKSLRTLGNTDRFRCWLYHIAKNKALNYIRRKQFIVWLSLDGAEEDDDLSIHSNWQSPDEWVLLKLALEEIKPKYRQCLVLQEILGLPQNEIAKIVGISKNSVSQYVKRAYEELALAYQ